MPSIHEIWFPLGNFLIFAFIIVSYALPPVRDFLQSRRDEVLATVREAAAKKQQAEAIVQDYKGRLARVEHEIQSMQRRSGLKAKGRKQSSLATRKRSP